MAQQADEVFLLLDSFFNLFETGNVKKSMDLILQANRLARQSNLIKIQNQIELYKRRFSRIQVSINQAHFRHIIQEMERSAYYISRKILEWIRFYDTNQGEMYIQLIDLHLIQCKK